MSRKRRTQAPGSGPDILHQRHHSQRRQPARTRLRTSDLPSPATFSRNRPNNTSGPSSRLQPQRLRLLGFGGNRILRPRLRPLTQGVGHRRLRARIDPPAHQPAAAVVHERRIHPLRPDPRRKPHHGRRPPAHHESLPRRRGRVAGFRRQARVALRLEDHYE